MRTITVYTDGGCRGNNKSKNIGAWAYSLECDGLYKEGSGAVCDTTNNKMELQAVIEALKVIRDKKAIVKIHGDSDSVHASCRERVVRIV